ncbi:hypothetical protein [Humidisolicoccus flavus]|uniref:hypothetical protein n=1 Tax=Humidisolicoccus flavus TaxID=3111414 RepID=UPI00324A6EF8
MAKQRLNGPEQVLAGSPDHVTMKYGYSMVQLTLTIIIFLIPTSIIVFWEPLFGDINSTADATRPVRRGLALLPLLIPVLYIYTIISLVQFLRGSAKFFDRKSGVRLKLVFEGSRIADVAAAEVFHRGFLYAEPRYYTPSLRSVSKRNRTYVSVWEAPGQKRVFAAVAYVERKGMTRLFPLVILDGAKFDVFEHHRTRYRNDVMTAAPKPSEAIEQWEILNNAGVALGERPPG